MINQHSLSFISLMIVVISLYPNISSAHCDSLDGPVVAAAKEAINTGHVERVLIWVGGEDEPAVREAYKETLAVRQLGQKAQSLADRYFFETVVRLHRAGEGEPFTGLKPAGRDLGPAIPAADKSLQTENYDAVAELLIKEVRHGLSAHFSAVQATKNYDSNDVRAGRAHVEAYVPFIHYVEHLYDAATQKPKGHFDSH